MAALKLFSKNGFDGTSTAEIAEESGMSQATIFKYFKTKDDLLQFILQPIMENLIPLYVDEFRNELKQKGLNLEQLIHFIVRNRYKFLVDNQEVAQIMISAILTKDEVNEKFVEILHERGKTVLETFVKLMHDSGEIRDELTPEDVIRTTISQILIYFIQNYKIFGPKSDHEVDRDLSTIEGLIIRSIKKPTE